MANAKVNNGGECGKCHVDFGKEKGKGANQAMICDLCEKWFHLECTTVPEALYKVISKFEVKAVKWLCEKCDRTFVESAAELKKKQESMEKELEKMGGQMAEMQAKLDEDNRKLKERMDGLEAEMTGMKNEIRDAGREVKERVMEKVSTDRQVNGEGGRAGEESREAGNEGWRVMNRTKERELQMQVVETMEREKRKNNIIIMGLSEEMNEKETEEFIGEMLGVILETEEVELKVHGRIGKKQDGDKKRPVKVEIKDATVRRRIIQKASNLKKETKYEKTYISPDLTRKQQEEDKALRDKVKEFRNQGMEGVKISKGCVVQEGQGGKKEVLYTPNQ